MPALPRSPDEPVLEDAGVDRRSVILFSAHPWQGNPYGLHHIARALAREGRPVLFVEPPFSPLHLLARRRRGRRFSRTLRPSEVPGISLFAPFSLLPYLKLPLLGSNIGLEYWPLFILNRLASAIRGTLFERPGIVISGASLFSRMVFGIDASFRGFRLADDDRLFDSVPESMRVKTRRELRRYDAVFTSTNALAESARLNGARKVVKMPNGFDERSFSGNAALPDDLAQLPSPRIVYVGALEAWFDWEVLIHAAYAMPNASFVVIGDAGRMRESVPANMHLLGARDHAQLGAYLKHCNAGVIPFKIDGNPNAMRAIDPIKLWEYLACGLPVVARAGLSLPHFPEAVYRYNSPSEFVSALETVLNLGKPAQIPDINHRSWINIVSSALHDALV
jgi:glycosyltransferase involved in cell wall biosynthesis